MPTDRSISPVMTISVIGSAISAIATDVERDERQNALAVVAKPRVDRRRTARAATSATRSTSRPSAAGCAAGSCAQVDDTAGLPDRLEPRCDPHGQRPVEADGQQQQGADDGLAARTADTEAGRALADRVQAAAPQRGAVDVPLPPKIATPPTTTAATTFSS